MKQLKTFLKNNDYSNPQYGYMDEEGNVVIEPQFFWAFNFDESGYARVWVNKDDKTYSLIDKNGEIVRKTPYTDIMDFNNGYAMVQKAEKNNERIFGVVDTNYNEVVSCVFDEFIVDEIIDIIRKNSGATGTLSEQSIEDDADELKDIVINEHQHRTKADPLRYLKQLQETFDGMWGRIHFRNNNPKYPSKHTGVFYIGFHDISDYNYTIREKVNNTYDDKNDPIIVTYNSMKELLLDGWEAD